MKTGNVTVKIASPDDMETAFAIRRKVFVEEQRVPLELELDEHEGDATHFLAYVDDEPVGTARMRWKDDYTAKAERVAVLKPFRGAGIGRELMHAIEKKAKQQKAVFVQLSAQMQAQMFYTRLGYIAYGDIYLDAGIEHIAMRKKL